MSRPPATRWIYEAALERSRLSPITRLVLATIARNADARTGIIPARFMPAAASLASRTGLSERAVRNHLNEAEAAGWLLVRRRSGRKSWLVLVVPDEVAKLLRIRPGDIPGQAVREQLLRAQMDDVDCAMSAAYRLAIRDDPCFYCGRRAPGLMQDDHFFSVAKGGTDHWWNLVRACGSCNLRKRTRCGTWFLLAMRDAGGSEAA